MDRDRDLGYKKKRTEIHISKQPMEKGRDTGKADRRRRITLLPKCHKSLDSASAIKNPSLHSMGWTHESLSLSLYFYAQHCLMYVHACISKLFKCKISFFHLQFFSVCKLETISPCCPIFLSSS